MARDIRSVLEQAAATPRRSLSLRELEARARRSRRGRALFVTGTVGLLAASLFGIFALEIDRPSDDPPPIVQESSQLDRYEDEELGFSVVYPVSWHRSEESLTPRLVDPLELFSIASFPLEYQRTDCNHVPKGALESMSPDDVFVSVQESVSAPGGAKGFDPRPASFADAQETEGFMCVPENASTYWVPFSDTGRSFYALAVFGPDASDERRGQAWAVLDSVEFSSAKDPTPTPDASTEIDKGWTELADAPEVRTTAATAWGDGQLFVWGGFVFSGYGDETSSGDGFLYDQASDTWSSLPEAPLSPRSGAVAAWTGQEFLVWGGVTNAEGSGPALADGAAFDPVSNQWRDLKPAPISARAPLSVWTGRELVVWGTSYRTGDPPRDGAIYDPATDSWRPITQAPITLTDATAAWTGEEMIVFGAELHGGNKAVTSTAIGAAYDPESDQWRRLPDSNLSPQASTATWNGKELIAWDYLNQSAAYNPDADSWRRLPGVPLDSGECVPQSVPVGRLVFGEYCGFTVAFDSGADAWARVRGAPPPGWGLGLVPGDDLVLVMARNVDTSDEAFYAYKP